MLRGFRYQVEQTILHWLALSLNQILCLECGEDIDIVSCALTKPQEEFSRDLVQIKHLDSSVTIRSPEIQQSIANFLDHQTNNPGHELRFRFCTTARIGLERPAILESRMPCLEFWEKARQRLLDQTALLSGCGRIRSYLVQATAPKDFNETNWKRFQQSIARMTDKEFQGVVEKMEWDTDATKSGDLESQAVLLLQQRNITENDARRLYPRLFLEVFKVISHPGPKKLLPTDFGVLLSQEVSPAEQQTIRLVSDRLKILEVRVDALEGTVIAMQSQIAGIFPTAIQLENSIVDATPPPQVEPQCAREEAVAPISAQFDNASWLHLYGGCGTGKTELALIVTEHISKQSSFWLSLRDHTIDETVHLALGLLAHLGNLFRASSFELQAVLTSLPSGSTVVLDDLPRLDGSDRLSILLTSLVLCCRDKSIRIITTSAHPLPSAIRSRLSGVFAEIEVPRFSDSDARELLKAHAAPDNILSDATVRLLNGLARGIPALLSAQARYLSQKGWCWDTQTLVGIFNNKHAANVAEDIMSRLSKTLDANSRELLYRLCFTISPFDSDILERVARVPLAVTHPRTTLSELLGPWIQHARNSRMTVNPLVRLFGMQEVAPNTSKGVHAVLADKLLSTRTIHIAQLSEILVHLLGSDQHDRAAFLLVFVLSRAENASTAALDFILAFLPPGVALPGVDTGTLALLRMLQAKALSQCGRNAEQVVHELDNILEKTNDSEHWVIAVVGMQASLLPSIFGVPRIARWLAIGARVSPQPKFHNQNLPLPLGISSVAQLLWMLSPHLQIGSDFLAWIQVVASLPQSQRDLFMKAELAEDGCLLAFDLPWMNECTKPANIQDWKSLLLIYQAAAKLALTASIELLYAFCVRAQVVILSEYLRRTEDAQVLVNQALERVAENDAKFVLLDIMGRQYCYLGRPTDGLQHLSDAAALSGLSFPGLRQQSWLWYSVALSSVNPSLSSDWADKAVALCKQRPERISEIELGIALGESCISHGNNGEYERAFNLLDEAVSILIREDTKTETVRQLIVDCAHSATYYSHIVKKGVAAVGFPAPVPGMFVRNVPAVAAQFRQECVAELITVLAMYAQHLGKTLRASVLALQALEMARRNGQWNVVALSGLQMLHALIADSRFGDAIDVALESMSALEAAKVSDVQSSGLSRTLSDILGKKPNEKWRLAEHCALTTALPPIICRLGLMRLQGDEITQLVESLCMTLRDLSKTASDGKSFVAAAQTIADGFGTSGGTESDYHKSAIEAGYVTYVLAFLTIGERSDVTLQTVARCQVLCLPDLLGRHSKDSPIRLEIMIPYLEKYWNIALQNQRFRFSAPALIESELKNAHSLPPSQRVTQMFRTVLSGLGIGLDKIPEPQRTWLNSD